MMKSYLTAKVFIVFWLSLIKILVLYGTVLAMNINGRLECNSVGSNQYIVTISSNEDGFYHLSDKIILHISNLSMNLIVNGVYYDLSLTMPRPVNNINFLPVSFPIDGFPKIPYKISFKEINRTGNKITLQIMISENSYSYEYSFKEYLGRYGIYSRIGQRSPDTDNIYSISEKNGKLWLTTTNSLIQDGELEPVGYRLYKRCFSSAHGQNCLYVSLSPFLFDSPKNIYIYWDISDGSGRQFWRI